MEKNENYYTINQVARFCSTSRSTIMRMEKDGILEPTYINEENGYRYYDIRSVLRVIRNLALRDLGVTHKEIAMYYSGMEHYAGLLKILEIREKQLRDLIALLRVQTKKEMHLHTATFDFPGMTCYTKVLKNIVDNTVIRGTMWSVVEEAVAKGFRIRRELHPFVSVNAKRFLKADFTNNGYDYVINIPILDEDVSDENVVFYPECHTISTLLYGGNRDVAEAFVRLGEQVRFRKSKVIGDARIIAIVNAYPGEDIPIQYWVSRVCVPIEYIPARRTQEIDQQSEYVRI